MSSGFAFPVSYLIITSSHLREGRIGAQSIIIIIHKDMIL